MATPPLNPLVEKIRAANPGAYDDMDDATLTKSVLAKYPQYEDLARPTTPMPGAPSTQPMTEEGRLFPGEPQFSVPRSVSDPIVSAEAQLTKLPAATYGLAKTLIPGTTEYQALHAQPILQRLGTLAKGLNPVVREQASLTPPAAAAAQSKGSPNPVDWGATAANVLPFFTDLGGGGITESPVGKVAGALAEKPVSLIQGAAKASGIGLSPVEKLVKAAGPSVRDAAFPQALEMASPEIARQNAVTPIKTVQDMADAAHSGANNIWKNHIEPQITRNASATINGGQTAAAIRSGIEPGMADLFPEQAKAANAFADKFEGNIPLSKANEYLKTLNAQLKGFYKMSPEARAAAGITDGRISAMQDAAQNLRQQMYGKLDSLGETDPAGLRQQYGALKQVQDVFRKRAIVSGRQAPLNLPQILGIAGGAGEMTTALFSGHPAYAAGGAATIAIPALLKYLNSPDMLVQRGVAGLPSALEEGATLPAALKGAARATEGGTPVPRSLGAAAAAPATAEPPTYLQGAAAPEQTFYHGANAEGTQAIEQSGRIEPRSLTQAHLTPDRATAASYAKNNGGKVFAVKASDLPPDVLAHFNETGRGPIVLNSSHSVPISTEGVTLPESLRSAAGIERRATPRQAPLNATELQKAIQMRRPVQTPFDVTQGAMETINRDRLMPQFPGQGGHAGGGVASVEELARPGVNYTVSKSGDLTYHGKSFDPGSTPKGGAHVTALPDGTLRVNEGTLTPQMEKSIRDALRK